LRGCQFARDLADQPVVLGQPKDKIDTVVLAPRHQHLAGKARIGTQQDAHLGPAGADAGDDPRDLFDAAGTGVDVRRAQFGGQQMPAAEHIERQIAVGVVIAVKETLFLMPLQRVVGGINVERDLRRRRRMGVEKQLDKQGFNRRRVMADLVVAGRLRAAQFQPVERRFAGQWRTILAARRQLAAEHCHHRVVAQLVVVDQVFVAQGNPEHPLTHQARHLVNHQIGITVIGKAAGKALDQPDLLISGAKQHRPSLRGHRAAVKRRHHLVPFNRCKTKQIRATLCRHRDSPWL
jgi:hypothetical protein